MKYYLSNGHIWQGSLEEVGSSIGLDVSQKVRIRVTVSSIGACGLSGEVGEVHFKNGDKLVLDN